MDNLSVHSSKKTVEWMESKGFDMNFTPVYSPEWNDAVEKTISVIKQYVKRKKLSTLISFLQMKNPTKREEKTLMMSPALEFAKLKIHL